MEIVLKPEEIAVILRIENQAVIDLLEDGELVGFKINSEWRVLGAELIRFLGDRMKKQQLESLTRQLSDPSEWAKELSRYPDLLKEIESRSFGDGTFGAFLKDGLKQQDALDKAKRILRSDANQSHDNEDID